MSEEQQQLIDSVNERIKAKCNEHGLEADSLLRYVNHGIEPGGFLLAVLQDKLVGAASRADMYNQRRLFEWADVMYNVVPRSARGSEENVARWIAHKGLYGLKVESHG